MVALLFSDFVHGEFLLFHEYPIAKFFPIKDFFFKLENKNSLPENPTYYLEDSETSQ